MWPFAFAHAMASARAYECAGDGSGSRPTIGLYYIAIDDDRVLAELFVVHY
jgi:hypothetical protein